MALDIDVRRLGTDIRVSTDPEADIEASPTGDIPMDSGRANLYEAVRRRILTVPGSIVFRNTFGGGVLDFVEAAGTAATRARLENQIRRNLLADPRIADVTVSAAKGTESDAQAAAVTVSLTVKVLKDTQADSLSLTIPE